MRFGIVGLGRMGYSLGTLAVERGHEVVGWDPSGKAREDAARGGIEVVQRLEDVVAAVQEKPRVLLMWAPHGDPVDNNLHLLGDSLRDGDIIADCGNSHWSDSRRRCDALAKHGVRFLDIGTSGGISDAHGWNGAAFMAGGAREAFDHVAPLLRDLAVSDEAVLYAGRSGSGHFVKLIHNAIEFGMIQAIAEGVEMLAGFDDDLDLTALFSHWNQGTVIRSWLIELMGNALAHGAIGPEADASTDMAGLSTYVEDTGEVKWVLNWAMDQDIPTPVTATAQQLLMAYRDLDW